MVKKSLSSTTGLTGFQNAHDQSGGNTHIDMRHGTVEMPAADTSKVALADYTVADWLVGGVYRNRLKILAKHGPAWGLLPEFNALVGMGEEAEKLPIKRFVLDASVRPVVEAVARMPRTELLAAFDKIPLPFPSVWLEMPYHQDGDDCRVRYAYWITRQDGHLRAHFYETMFRTTPVDGMYGSGMKAPEHFEIHPDRISIEKFSLEAGNKEDEDRIMTGIDIVDREAVQLLAALVVLGSKRFNTALFQPETPEETAARAKEFRTNRMLLRSGKTPRLPLAPIKVEIGPRLAAAIAAKRMKEVKQLLGITAVVEHDMHLRDGRVVRRKAHDRHFPADEPVDRRGVMREVHASAKLQELLAPKPPEDLPPALAVLANPKPVQK